MHKQSALKQALVEGSGEGWAGSGGWIGRGFSYWLSDSKARIQCRTSESACDGTTARDPPHFSSSSHCQVVCSVHHAARVTATLAPVVQHAGEAVRSSSGLWRRPTAAAATAAPSPTQAEKRERKKTKTLSDPLDPPSDPPPRPSLGSEGPTGMKTTVQTLPSSLPPPPPLSRQKSTWRPPPRPSRC